MTAIERRRNCSNESGFFTIWVLGLCAMVFFIGGISFDAWHAFDNRRELSSIADAAAVAGASQIDLARFKQGGDPFTQSPSTQSVVTIDEAAAKQRALQYIDSVKDDANVSVDSANVVVRNGALVVTLNSKLQLAFGSLLMPDASDIDVTVQGVAEPRPAR